MVVTARDIPISSKGQGLIKALQECTITGEKQISHATLGNEWNQLVVGNSGGASPSIQRRVFLPNWNSTGTLCKGQSLEKMGTDRHVLRVN